MELEPTIYNDDKLIDIIFAEQMSRQMFIDLFKFHASNLVGGVGYGFGLPSDFVEGSKNWKMAKDFKQNCEFFSHAKTDDQVKQLNDFVFNDKGKRPFSEFKTLAKSFNENYNVNWLKTELDTAFSVAQSVEQWQGYEKEKDIFPYLQYVTVGDGRVRPEHAQWDGLIYPVGHSFWDTRYPPNDWWCRCRVIQLRDAKTTTRKDVPENTSAIFSNNPAKTNVIYPKTGIPYQKEGKEVLTITDKEVRQTMNKQRNGNN